MDLQQIRDAYHARPFRSFKLVLSDGRSLEVYDECCMAISPTGRQLIVLDRRGRWTALGPPEIDSLEYCSAKANGTSAPPPV